MSKSYSKLFIFSILLSFTWQINAQTTLQGQLLDQQSKAPLPYATVALYELSDSTMATNALSDNDGKFTLEAAAGNYYALIQYIGYEDKYVPNITVNQEKTVLKLGKIRVRADAVALQEVEVKAERSQMQFKLDRRVFNVGKDLTNAGNNAADILDKVPSVEVDPEGNVSLRGSQSVRILVNGKPSGLLSAGETEALLRMQGDIIESIEVITNPSARYEAEGEAGIINIILKKNKEKGFNGSFGATMGYPQNFGASYNLNYRQSDFNFFSNFGIDYRKAPGGGDTEQRYFENNLLTQLFTTNTEQLRGGLGGYMQLGTDWNINEYHLITGSLLYRLGEDDNSATVTYRDLNPSDGSLLSTTVRDIAEVEEEHNLEASVNYRRSFDEEDREWTIDFKYILDDDTEIADYEQTTSGLSSTLLQESSNTEDEINMLIQTDYIHPIGEKSRIEGGLRAAFRTVNNDFFVREQNEDGTFVTLSDFDDRLKYTENIYAAYLIGAHEFERFSVQVGVRSELSDITAALLKSNQSNDQDYINLFPSASVSYKLTDADQFQISYSRRLSRPYFRRLLPFSNYNNPRNNRIGNPNLRPEFTDSYEAGFLKYFEKGSFLSGIYYRYTTGVIERLTLPAEDGTAIEFPVNLSERNSYGLEVNFTYDLISWLGVNADFNFFRAMLNGEFEGVDYSADTYSWSGRVNSKITVNEALKFQTSFDYNAPYNTTQGRRLASYMLDIAASLDVFEGKGTFTLSGRDLFNTRIRRTLIDLPNYEEESTFQWRQTRQVILTFNYRLNQDKPQIPAK
jgi:outer membrane receptor protein involved in Fe transport